MATLGDKSVVSAEIKVDGTKAKKTLVELQKIVEDLNKDIDSTGEKFSVAAKKFNKLLASSLTRYNRILFKQGVEETPTVASALALQKSQSKQLNNLFSINPNRANAQLTQINNKIAKDAATVFSDTFAKNLEKYARNKSATGVKGFDSGLFMTSSKYRSIINQGFSQLESQLTSKILSGKRVDTYIKQLERVKALHTSMVEPMEHQIRAQERLKTVSGGVLAFIQARLLANYTILNSVTRSFSYLANYVVEFDQELKNLQAIVNVSDAGLEKLRDSIIDVADSTKFTSLEVSRAAVVLGQAGLSIQQIKDTLGPIAQLATATGTDLATSTQTITSALNIYNLQADEAAYITNALTTAMNESKAEIKGFQYALQYAGNTAANLGVSFEETAAATAALAQSGIKSVSTQGTGLRAIFTELIKPTKKFQDQLAKVGLTTADVDVKTKGFIPVLKTLKEAGFGVTEAYRGMERRGAAAMVAILNQTDFMDDLTDKMSTSTAGVKANQTQMEGLSNTFKNTQSVIGSLTYKGFAPLISGTQSLLENFNGLAKSTAGVATAFTILLTLGSGITAVMIKTAAATASLGATFIKYKGMAAFFGAIAGAGTLKIGLVIAGITTLAVGISKLVEKFDLLGNSYDEAVSKFEDEQGKLNKAKESYDAFSDVVAKAYIQREKFSGPEGQRELDKFTNMIRTRFPQISEIMKEPITSFEQLAEVLKEATVKMSEFNAVASISTPQAAKAMVNKASAQAVDNSNASDLLSQFGFLERQGIISSEQASRLRSGIQMKSGFADLFGGQNLIKYSKSNLSPNALAEAIRNSYNQNPDLVTQAIKTALSDSTNNLSEELRQLFEDFLKELQVVEEKNRVQLGAELDKDFASFLHGTLNVATNDLGYLRSTYNGLLNNPNISSQDFVTRFGAIQAEAENTYRFLTDNSSIDRRVTDILSYDRLREYANKYTSGDTLKARKLIAEKIKELYSGVASDYLNFITDDLGSISGDVLDSSAKASEQGRNRRVNNSIKSLSSTPINQIGSKVQQVLNDLKIDYETSKAKIITDARGDAVALTLRDDKLAELAQEYEEQVNRVNQESANIKATFNRLSESERKYFDSIQATVKALDSQYKRSISAIENRGAGLKGESAAYGVLGAGVLQSGADYRLSQLQLGDYASQYAAANTALSGYRKAKADLEASKEFSDIARSVNKARAELDNLKNSGTATADSLEQAQRTYDEAVAEQKKYTDTITDLDEKIIDLEGSLVELKATIDKMDYLKRDDDFLGSAKLGWQSAVDSYAEGNSYMGKDKGANFVVANVIGETFYPTLTEAEDALATFFDTAINGTKSTGDAFRDMCQSILRAMEQALYSEMAKQFMAMIFGSFTGDEEAGNGTSTIIQGIGSLISAGISSIMPTPAPVQPKSHGGLVTGGIANRDSVGAKLMPGEYVMRKSAVDSLGADFLARLNSGNMDVIGTANQTMQEKGDGTSGKKSSTLNIWVVTPDQVPPENPENIIMTVSKDIRTNGSIKQLIKQVNMGVI